MLTHVCVLGCRLFVPLLPSQVPSSDSGKAHAKRKSGAPTTLRGVDRARTARAAASTLQPRDTDSERLRKLREFRALCARAHAGARWV